MSQYKELIAQRRRLMMLVLTHKLGNEANVDIMHMSIGPIVPSTLDDLRAEMQWLSAEGLASITRYTDDIQAMTLTRRGAEIANGSNTHVGVARLMPGDKEAL
jgi:hypothetical protein